MLCLPRPYPDEVVGSVVLRACRHTALPYKRLAGHLAECGGGNGSFLLSAWLKRVGALTGMEPERLLWEHTMFPYISAFMDPALVSRLANKVLQGTHSGGALASLAKAVTHGTSCRRFCPQCLLADLDRFGETYWHRKHILPGSHICLVHGCLLCETAIPLGIAVGVRTIDMPGETRGLGYRSRLERPVLERLGSYSEACLIGNAAWGRGGFLDYREAALRSGYDMMNGNVAGAQLAEDLQRFYGRAFLAETGCAFKKSLQTPWPALLVRSQCASLYATPKHVLLAAFLDFAGSERKKRSYARPGPRARSCSQADRNCRRAIDAILRAVAAAGSRITVRELLTQAGYWAHFRHHRPEYPRTAAFLNMFRTSALSERQVGRRPCWRKRLGLDRSL